MIQNACASSGMRVPNGCGNTVKHEDETIAPLMNSERSPKKQECQLSTESENCCAAANADNFGTEKKTCGNCCQSGHGASECPSWGDKNVRNMLS